MTVAKTLRETKIGGVSLRLVQRASDFAGAIFVDGKMHGRIEGSDADEVWQRLERQAGKSDPGYLGYDEACSRFLHYFPGGFGSESYRSTERNYKVAAREKLLEAAPLDAVLDGEGFAEAAVKALQRTNLVYPVEKTRATEMLRGPKGDAFMRAAASFALEPEARTLAQMEKILRDYDNARWTVATYLPFLWNPSEHMYLKPQVTQDFARRVGHPFANVYDSSLDIGIYESLLDLVAETEREIASLAPVDRIDTQSFIWVIGDYKPGDEELLASAETAA